jgi:hypothetical protein
MLQHCKYGPSLLQQPNSNELVRRENKPSRRQNPESNIVRF